MSDEPDIARIAAGLTLSCSKGTVEVHAGERFDWWDGTTWEIVGAAPGWNYSPSNLGGCPSVVCRHLGGELDAVMAHYTVDGLCDWCGDSVAAGVMATKARLERQP